MKANELRIGNYVQGKYDEYKLRLEVFNIVKSYARCYVETSDLEDVNPPYDMLEGIPLTEEWLIKFGFENKHKEIEGLKWDNHYIKGYVKLYKCGDGSQLSLNDFLSPNTIYHVHQLQNLYFALVGEELTIKE